MKVKKLGRPSDERMAVLRNQATDLFMYGKIETTVEKAKSLASYAEKTLTMAIKTCEDVITLDGKVKDGPKKLAARRKMMARLYKVSEKRLKGESKADYLKRLDGIQNPVIEKIFNVYAPRYLARIKETNQGGGYTRIVKIGKSVGDNADMAIISLID